MSGSDHGRPDGASKLVSRPVARRREIPFGIGGLALGLKERLETGRLPQPVATRRLAGRAGSRSGSPGRRRRSHVARRAEPEGGGIVDIDPQLERRAGGRRAGMRDEGKVAYPPIVIPAKAAVRRGAVDPGQVGDDRGVTMRTARSMTPTPRPSSSCSTSAAISTRRPMPRRSMRWRHARSSPATSGSTRPRRASTSAAWSRS